MVDLRIVDGGDAEVPVVRQPRQRFCRHGRFRLDETARRVYCGECEQEVDAFGALYAIATMFERVNSQYKHAQAEAKHVEQRLEELKRLERNAKARVRRTR
jgi:hypothetical protein